MIYDLNNPYDKERFRERVKALAERSAVVSLTEKKPQRTLAQNAYLHLLLGYFAAEFGYTLDEVKIKYFKETCNADMFREEITNKRGERVVRLRSSASLDTGELSSAIERFRNWSSSEAGLYLPAADEYQAQIYAQQQIENYKDYE